MVCVACLIPLFLIPIINLLPRILDLILRKLYSVLGWEYKQPVRVPPSCPIKSSKPSNVKPIQMNGVAEEVAKQDGVGEQVSSSISDMAKRD